MELWRIQPPPRRNSFKYPKFNNILEQVREMKAASSLFILLVLLSIFVDGGASQEYPQVIPASAVLDKIEIGKPVDYNNVIIEGDLDLSQLNLQTINIDRSKDEQDEKNLSDKAFIVNSSINITYSWIKGNVSFDNSLFNRIINFKDTIITKDACFMEPTSPRLPNFITQHSLGIPSSIIPHSLRMPYSIMPRSPGMLSSLVPISPRMLPSGKQISLDMPILRMHPSLGLFTSMIQQSELRNSLIPHSPGALASPTQSSPKTPTSGMLYS